MVLFASNSAIYWQGKKRETRKSTPFTWMRRIFDEFWQNFNCQLACKKICYLLRLLIADLFRHFSVKCSTARYLQNPLEHHITTVVVINVISWRSADGGCDDDCSGSSVFRPIFSQRLHVSIKWCTPITFAHWDMLMHRGSHIRSLKGKV